MHKKQKIKIKENTEGSFSLLKEIVSRTIFWTHLREKKDTVFSLSWSHRRHHLQHNQLKSKISRKMGGMSTVILFCLGSAPSPTSLTDIVLNQNR